MRNLLRILLRIRVTLIFIMLQVVSLILMFTHNDYQSAGLFVGSNQFFGGIYNTTSRMSNFISLEQQNEQLQAENAELRRMINQVKMRDFNSDAIVRQEYIAAKVVSNSVGLTHNYIVLNKGLKDGVKPRMGVITDNGIVGKIKECSDNFSVAFSLLNPKLMVSGRIHRTGKDSIKNQGLATIRWTNTLDPTTMSLLELSAYVPVRENDTIVTAGFDGVFPGNYPIGKVKGIRKTEGDKREIDITLNADMGTVSHVYIVNALQKEELDSLKQTQIPAEIK